MPWKLSDNHRRGIAATLGILDEMLCDFERWARGEQAEGVLYRERNTLSASKRRTILREIAAQRKILIELRDELGLKVRTEDTTAAIWSRSSARWESLMELGAKHLRRYGHVPDGFAAYFEPKLERLVEHLTRITDATGGEKQAGE